uniref:Uncharacterized protein n=1 Tax=Populus trichocarpa TaxID=3694 RepID=A0A3N7EHZ8_POPTR
MIVVTSSCFHLSRGSVCICIYSRMGKMRKEHEASVCVMSKGARATIFDK